MLDYDDFPNIAFDKKPEKFEAKEIDLDQVEEQTFDLKELESEKVYLVV